MRSWPLGLRIGVGVIAVLAVVLILRPWGSSQPSLAPQSGSSTPAHSGNTFSDRVRQRIDQLRGGRPGATAEGGRLGDNGRLNVPAGLAVTPGTRMHGASGTGPATGAQAGAPAAQLPAEEEPTPLIDDPEDIPTLQKLALDDPDPDKRLAAVALLGASEDAQVIPTLGQALSDQNEEVRMAALESLSDFTDEPPVEAIENALNDSSADIRFEALSILADIGGERVRGAIERAMNDPDEEVRNLAEGILDLETVYPETPAAPQPNDTPQPNG